MSERGYSLIELLVSAGILLVVFGSVCQIVSPEHSAAFVQAETQDMQQRARVLADRLTHDLWLAGAGPTSGSRRGTLALHFAPLLPSICCGSAADPPNAVFSDRLTVMYVPRGSPEALTSSPIAPDALRLDVASGPSCPSSIPACGFVDGELLIVFDDSGRSDIFRLDLASGVPVLAPLAATFDSRYESGATVCRVVVHTYYRDAASNEVFTGDGDGPPQPIVDRVSGLRLEYEDASGGLLDTLLADGPWRGWGSSSYDADLLRVGRVRVSYAIRSGLSGSGSMRIPDLTSTFEVALRNFGDHP